MNKFTRTISLATMTVVVLGAYRSAAAQAIKVEYQGLETLIRPVSPGIQWITADRVLHIRNRQTLLFDDTSDLRVRGEALISVNADLKLAPPPVLGYGPMRGPIHVQNAGGSWVGTWVGTRTVEGHSYIWAVMRGRGAYKGLHAKATYVRQTPDPAQPYVIQGVIIETPK